MLKEDLVKYITEVPGFPKEGINFKDITTLLEDPDAFHEIINCMWDYASACTVYDKIVCADARGFLFGAPLAYETGHGLVLARKPGKLPRPGVTVSYDLEYGSNSMVLSAGSVNPGDRCLIVDDLLATGGSAKAMADLVIKSGGVVVGFVFALELMACGGRERLKPYAKVKSCIKYGVAKGNVVTVDLTGIVDDDQERYNGRVTTIVSRIPDADHIEIVYSGLEEGVSNIVIPKSRIISLVVDNEASRYIDD